MAKAKKPRNGNGRKARNGAAPAVSPPLPETGDLPESVRLALLDLTPLEQRFIVYYCEQANGNGTLAAELAGVSGDYATRSVRASQILREPRVRKARDAWMTAFALSAAEVTAEMASLATANLGPFVECAEDGTLTVKVRSAQDWEAYKSWVKAFEADPKTGRITKLQLHDRHAALRDLAKILKLFSDAPQLSLQVYLRSMSDDQVAAAWEEAQTALRSTAVQSPN